MSVFERLGPVRRNGAELAARCPAHPDRVASLSIRVREDGQVLLFCHAGCATRDVLHAAGLTWQDLQPADRSPPLVLRSLPGEERAASVSPLPVGREVAAYPYTDERGEILFEVVRFEPKAFRQRRRGPYGPVWGLGSTRRVLFRLPKVNEALRASERLWLCEGEKDVLALEGAGVVATSPPMGAGKWRREYSESLRGGLVWIVADRDGPGRRHARDVASALRLAGATGWVVEARVGKDAADHLAAGYSVEEFRRRYRF